MAIRAPDGANKDYSGDDEDGDCEMKMMIT